MKIKLKKVISAHQFGLFREAKKLIATEFGNEHAVDLKLQSATVLEEMKVFVQLSKQGRLKDIYQELGLNKTWLLKTAKQAA